MTQQRLSTLSLRVRNLPASSRASSYEAFSDYGEVGRKARVVLRLLNVRLELEARYGDARRAPRVGGTQGRSRRVMVSKAAAKPTMRLGFGHGSETGGVAKPVIWLTTR